MLPLNRVADVEVERVERPTADLQAYLDAGPIRNAWVVHDLAEDFGETELWVARRGPTLVGQLLVKASPPFGVNWAHVAGEPTATGRLVSRLPEDRVVVITPPESAPAVVARFPRARVCAEHIMGLERGHERLGPLAGAVRVSPDRAEEYARLVVPSMFPITPEVVERNRRHLEENIVYGIVWDGRLVAVAGISVRTAKVWIIGGVETIPSCRRRGFARAVTSAVAREALAAVGRAGLWVTRENAAAIGLYRSLGFSTVGESVWIDVGTGLDP